MTRPEPLQHLLDVALPGMQARAHDGDSPASLARITEASRMVGNPGAAPASLPVCNWLDRALA
ncbi:hypothetical protein, partial [Paracoccus sp. (in: a-proteobacteria)]|uniref:hypothetical protein n=1 Tax=Paracoccus sp. TaxID=267 RepID=UPI0028A79B52